MHHPDGGKASDLGPTESDSSTHLLALATSCSLETKEEEEEDDDDDDKEEEEEEEEEEERTCTAPMPKGFAILAKNPTCAVAL